MTVHPLQIVAKRIAELDDLRRIRGLSPVERAELDRLYDRRRIIQHRLPIQIAAAEEKLARLRALMPETVAA